MKFEDFVRRGDVRKTSKDERLVKSLVSNSQKDIVFLDSLKLNENSVRKIFSSYYDVLRSILEAIAALDGFKVYLHEAFTYFLKEKDEEKISFAFDRFRRMRNKINYYGVDISVVECKVSVEEMKEMIKFLVDKYLKGVGG